MAKQKKKRSKQYRGKDSKTIRPSVVHLEAANRNALSQWWYERKALLRPVLIAALVLVVVVWLLFELIRILA